jgi:hypothetical protein
MTASATVSPTLEVVRDEFAPRAGQAFGPPPGDVWPGEGRYAWRECQDSLANDDYLGRANPDETQFIFDEDTWLFIGTGAIRDQAGTWHPIRFDCLYSVEERGLTDSAMDLRGWSPPRPTFGNTWQPSCGRRS